MILKNIVRILYDSRYYSKKILLLISIIIAALIADISLINIYDFITSQALSSWRIAVFIVISAVYIIGQYLVLEFVKHKSNEIRAKEDLHLDTIRKMVTIVQYTLTAILLFVLLQILMMSSYNVVILIVAVAISYILAIIMIGLLAQRFFSWFKSNRNSVVLFYGLASTMLAINGAFTFVLVDVILLNRPTEVIPHVGTAFTTFISGSATAILNSAYIISSTLSFVLMWIATALLLRHYSQKIGRVKYWIIISIPLVYFLSQFLTLFLNLFAPLLQSNPIFYSIVLTLIFTLSKPAGGILFGIAFWTIARSLSQSATVRNYMTISAYGFVLLFISNQGILISAAPYPPFGLATVSFMGLSSYLILVGVYASAISVAQDSKLRQSIRKFAIREESKLLDSIGSSQMEQEIRKKVIMMTKEHRDRMIEETGVQTSINKEEINQYLEEVLKEIKKKK